MILKFYVHLFSYNLRKLAYYLEIIKTGKHNIYHVIWLIEKSLIMR